MHVHVLLLPVEVRAPLPLLPADLPAQQEAVCKREGDVRDQDEQQVEGKHRGITEALVQRLREENLGYPRFGCGHDKGGNVKCARNARLSTLLRSTSDNSDTSESIHTNSFSSTSRFPTVVTNICLRAIEPI